VYISFLWEREGEDRRTMDGWIESVVYWLWFIVYSRKSEKGFCHHRVHDDVDPVRKSEEARMRVMLPAIFLPCDGDKNMPLYIITSQATALTANVQFQPYYGN
jgi:hypothetical protein